MKKDKKKLKRKENQLIRTLGIKSRNYWKKEMNSSIQMSISHIKIKRNLI